MPDFRGLLARITESLDAHGVAFMVIGGQTVLVHGGRASRPWPAPASVLLALTITRPDVPRCA